MGTTEGAVVPDVLEGSAIASESSQAAVGQVRRVTELRPHPGLVKHTLGYSTQELSTLSERGESAYSNLVTITHENVILDGYAVWQLAKLQNRENLNCVVRRLNQEEALLQILDRNRGSKGIGDFVRILMALELEPWFKVRAKLNQRIGGREKGSTQLAEAEKLDVRIEVARAAGVSAGNVSKVKKILQSAIPELLSALCSGEVLINRGSIWAKSGSSAQANHLANHRNERGVRRTINILLRRHEVRHPQMCEGLRNIQRGVKMLHADTSLYQLVAALCSILREIDGLLVQAKRRDRAA
jgi:hypothetical protein